MNAHNSKSKPKEKWNDWQECHVCGKPILKAALKIHLKTYHSESVAAAGSYQKKSDQLGRPGMYPSAGINRSKKMEKYDQMGRNSEKLSNKRGAHDYQTDSIEDISQAHCNKDIILVSRRGTSVGSGYCDNCGFDMGCLTHYTESNVGPVNICDICKAEIRDRSFAYLDVFSRRRVIGGFRW